MARRADRAKIFAPFDALKGFKEALAAQEVIIVPKVELSEDQKEVLLNVVMQEIHGNMTVNYVNLQGLKCSAVYRDTETGKTYNGAALMEAGIPMPVEMGEFKAYQMHLVGEE